MKKFTLMAAFAALAMTANAQYTCETPYANADVIPGVQSTFDIVVGSSEALAAPLEAAGQKVNNFGPDDVTRFLYIWDGTFVGGDGSYPGVGYSDMQFDGYTSLDVTSVGWSGAGWFITPNTGISTEHWCDQTKFHVAYRTVSTGPSSVAIIINDAGEQVPGSAPAKFAVGTAFNDGGAIYPTIGPALNDEWQAVEISFADLKKIYPSFNYIPTPQYGGNVVSILGGGVTGQNISLDCMYFFTPGDDAAVGSISDDANFVITGNTVNVNNGQGIELYDLSGRLIKSTNNSVMGIGDLNNGMFIVKSGNSITKIMK